MPPVVERLARTTVPAVTTPVLWICVATLVWQALQSTGRERVPSTCEACTPTPFAVATAVLPKVSGAPTPVGAAATLASWLPLATSVLLPWQLVQVSVEVSMAPFTCRPPATSTAPAALTVPAWQEVQVVGAAALWSRGVAEVALGQLPESAAAP